MPSPTIRMTFLAWLVLRCWVRIRLHLLLRLLEIGIVTLNELGVLRSHRRAQKRKGRYSCQKCRG